jgi:hypothetical protein
MEKGLQNGLQKGPKKGPKFSCEKCDFICYKQYQWDRHLLTLKHSKDYKMDYNGLQKGPEKGPESAENDDSQNSEYLCFCGKIYKHRQGLYKHKKLCNFIDSHENEYTNTNISQSNDVKYLTSLVLEVVKNNSELQKQNFDLQSKMMDICVSGSSNSNSIGVINNNLTSNISNVNSNNKTFNLQFFLNETCKDAMNISDFIESVKLQVSDLENVGKLGYIEGISNIIIKNLQALEVEKRPVHCTDKKREIMYVKEDNVWEKEDEANKRLRKAIRKIAHKNICMFKEFREKYPDCEEYDSKRNSQYNIIVYEAMGGKGDNDYEKDTKIIKKIAKVVGIEKC